MKTSMQDFVCRKLLFSIYRENLEIHIFLRIFWSDTLTATDIANMLSLLKRCFKHLFYPQINSETVNVKTNGK